MKGLRCARLEILMARGEDSCVCGQSCNSAPRFQSSTSKKNHLKELVHRVLAVGVMQPLEFVHVSSLGPERLQEARNGAADPSGRVRQARHRGLQAEESTS